MTGVAVVLAACGVSPLLDLAAINVAAVDTYNSPLIESVSAVLTVKRDGTITKTTEAGTTSVQNWHRAPSGTVGDNFWVKYDYSGDALEGGSPADNTYVQLNSDRAFTQTQSGGVGNDATTGTLYIARDASGTGAKSCTLDLSATLN